jgi:putative sterol carrier protein
MSRVYEQPADFETLFARLFSEIEHDDRLDELVEQQMVIRFRIREPEVELWIDGRSAPVHASFGNEDLDATLTVDLTGNSLHELLLGTLPLGKAMLFRKLKVDGSKSKAMKLEPVLHVMQAAYPALADELLSGS